MIAAFREHSTVRADGSIQIRSTTLPPGARVEVIVLLEVATVETPTSPPDTLALTDFIGAGKGIFATPEEADAFLRSERDAWER